VISVQQWAEIRRMHFVEGLGIREIRRRTGLHRETIRRASASSTPPRYSRPAPGSQLDPFKDEIHALLRDDPEIESQRIREILIESGFDGGKTITDDYVREVRAFFVDQRTYQRTNALYALVVARGDRCGDVARGMVVAASGGVRW
jgi:transposase